MLQGISASRRAKKGRVGPVVLGFDDLQSYLEGSGYLGATVGRFANRIANAQFTIDNVEHKLTPNAGKHHIHGGGRKEGFAWQVWKGQSVEEEDSAGVKLTLVSPDGQAGFPGQLLSPITLSGHFDVVPPEPDDRQFQPRVDGDYLWGRGAADMKTVVASTMVWLAERCNAGPPYPPVNTILVGNEENGEGEPWGTPHVLADLAESDPRSRTFASSARTCSRTSRPASCSTKGCRSSEEASAARITRA